MSDKTAAERLRDLLDELQIQHFDYDKGGRTQTLWEAPDGKRHFTYETFNNPAKSTRLTIAWFPTPEQAIAATLGNDGPERSNDGVAVTVAPDDYTAKLMAEVERLQGENEQLRELVNGMRYCANEAYGMCARVPVGGERPFTCCPLYDFDTKEYRCEKLMHELGIEEDE